MQAAIFHNSLLTPFFTSQVIKADCKANRVARFGLVLEQDYGLRFFLFKSIESE